MSVAVVRGRDTIVMKGYGLADVENDVAATAQSVYRIGSITKQFTAAAVMQLVEQNKVSLDDSIGKHLPHLAARWHGATIRQLLNHTSGIPSYTGAGPRWTNRMREDLAHDSLLAIVAGDTLDFAPGSQWRYNNTGYYLLGMLIERVAGRSYADDVRERFAKPLGLTSTLYCETQPIIKRRAQGYQVGPDKKLVNAAPLSMRQPFSAGALCSTVGDLVAWQRALAAGRVVKPGSYSAMTTAEGAAVGSRYGFGLASDTLAGRTSVEHGGGINGFNSMLTFFPSDTLSIAVLGNTNGPWVNRVADNIARAALRVPLTAPLLRIPGMIEGESLLETASVTAGELRVQDMGGFEPDSGRWSGGTQLWWVLSRPGARLTLDLRAPTAGTYELVGYFTRAQDYGDVRLDINGRALSPIVRGYSPTVEPTGPVSFGRVPLRVGSNTLTVEIVGKDARSQGYSDGYLVGIDGFVIRRAQ